MNRRSNGNLKVTWALGSVSVGWWSWFPPFSSITWGKRYAAKFSAGYTLFVGISNNHAVELNLLINFGSRFNTIYPAGIASLPISFICSNCVYFIACDFLGVFNVKQWIACLVVFPFQTLSKVLNERLSNQEREERASLGELYKNQEHWNTGIMEQP